jgi:hypothetical protein
MISGTIFEQTTDATLRRAAVTLPPKRRSKVVSETAEAEGMPAPTVPHFPRHHRLKRSGRMSLSWRTGSDDQGMNTVRISPEILSAFNNAIGAFGESPARHPAHAAA